MPGTTATERSPPWDAVVRPLGVGDTHRSRPWCGVRRIAPLRTRLALVAVLLSALAGGRRTEGASVATAPLHAPYARILAAVVVEDRVDYARLKSQPQDLDAYLHSLARLPAVEVDAWPRADRLALFLNLYNAATLRLVADHFPIGSIRDIGLLPGSAWKREVVRFGGRTMSLDHLEHGILRPGFREPRVHFALVCAARGCPPLRSEPYLPDRLDAQLDDQARRFLAQSGKNRLDPESRTLWLSPIFEWFAEDFTAGGRTVAEYVRPYLPAEARARWPAPGEALRVRHTEYDWSLNGIEAR